MDGKSAAPGKSQDAWLEIEASAVKRRITQEGVSPDRASTIVERYRAKVVEGVPPRYAEAHIRLDVLRAKRESEIDGLVSSLAARFHLPVDVVAPLLAKSVKRLRENPHVLVRWAVEKHESQLKDLSKEHADEAYKNRRATKSPLAAALVKSGALAYLKAEDS